MSNFYTCYLTTFSLGESFINSLLLYTLYSYNFSGVLHCNNETDDEETENKSKDKINVFLKILFFF